MEKLEGKESWKQIYFHSFHYNYIFLEDFTQRCETNLRFCCTQFANLPSILGWRERGRRGVEGMGLCWSGFDLYLMKIAMVKLFEKHLHHISPKTECLFVSAVLLYADNAKIPVGVLPVGQNGGITYALFSPSGLNLYTGYRSVS